MIWSHIKFIHVAISTVGFRSSERLFLTKTNGCAATCSVGELPGESYEAHWFLMFLSCGQHSAC